MYTARVYLFKSITYRVDAEIHWGTHQTPPPLRDLLDFLVATPSVCPHIRDLRLVMHVSHAIQLHSISLWDTIVLRGGDLAALYAILQHTPRLRSLAVHNFRFADPGSTLTLPPIADGPALQHLESLYICHREPFPLFRMNDHPYQLFYLLGSIRKVVFDTQLPSMRSFGEVVPSWPRRALRRVHELSMTNPKDVQYLRTIDYARLHACYFQRVDEPADVALLANWLRTAGRGLRGIEFPVRMHLHMLRAPADPFLDVLDLSVLARLDTLTLVLTLFADFAQGVSGFLAPVYAFLCRALSATASSLRSLTIRVESWDISSLPTLQHRDSAFDIRPALVTDWRELDKALVGCATTARLRKVRFVEEPWEEDEMRPAIASALPEACARGLVHWGKPNSAHWNFWAHRGESKSSRSSLDV